MQFIIVTGMSGAGKTQAFKILEDFGYYCVDNLPGALIPEFTRLVTEKKDNYEKVALGIDSRSDLGFRIMEEILSKEELKDFPWKILFMDAKDETLIRRYKETRRRHPLADKFMANEIMEQERSLEDCIRLERERLSFLRERADYVLDTSRMLIKDLKAELERVFVDDETFHSMNVTLKSFGFKYGVPQDADLVFDARFLPNPYYIEELKPLSGNDSAVYDYVMNFDVTKQFYEKLLALIDFLIPNYIAEGKTELVIAIGCTGGRHRSVTMVNALYKALDGGNYGLRKEHSVVGNN